MNIQATIHELGNGFPETGNYIPGNDGNLYRLVRTNGRIFTGSCGSGNYIHAELELADWDEDLEEDEEPFPAQAVLEGDDQ